MLKKALFSLVVTSYFFGYSQTNIPVEKLLDSVEDYYTLDKENAFKLLAETKLDSTSEKNLDLVGIMNCCNSVINNCKRI